MASNVNDNVFLMNDNGIYMSKGKVVNGESVGVGSITESFTAGPTGRQKEIKTSLFLRKAKIHRRDRRGDNPRSMTQYDTGKRVVPLNRRYRFWMGRDAKTEFQTVLG